MRKYLFIYKATLIESLQYVLNTILGFLSYFMILFVLINLWSYLYSDGAQSINGYTLPQVLWYVIFTEILWFGSRNRTLTRQITSDIKSGTIAYGINKPYHYLLYVIFKHLGEITIKMFLYLGAGIVIGLAFVGPIPGFLPYQLPFILLSTIFSLFIDSFLRIIISVLSFWIEDSLPFHWIYDKIIIVIGIFYPIEMFPEWSRPLLRLSPIYVVNYGPAKLTIDFSYEVFLQVTTMQVIYLSIAILLMFIVFQKGVKKLNVNGG